LPDRVTTTLTLVHPKGGVGRSTSAYMLGAELALRGYRVALIDRDQGRHLSRLLEFYPLGIDTLVLGDRADGDVDFRVIDTAPEMDFDRTLVYLHEADWAIIPVKGPEAGSVLALPQLLEWLDQAQGARLLGFLPTMYKARRAEARRWLEQLQVIAAERQVCVFPPIKDLAALASYRLDGHPYAPIADAVEQVLRGARI
jgi:cellulose biosynthesis protein BcsQ